MLHCLRLWLSAVKIVTYSKTSTLKVYAINFSDKIISDKIEKKKFSFSKFIDRMAKICKNSFKIISDSSKMRTKNF